MDTITLKDLKVLTKIGCAEEERKNPQEIFVSIECRHPTAHVAEKDRLDEAIDYLEAMKIIEVLAKEERWTIERFAEDIAKAVLKRWKLQGGVRVAIKKHPPIPAKEVSVTIERP